LAFLPRDPAMGADLGDMARTLATAMRRAGRPNRGGSRRDHDPGWRARRPSRTDRGVHRRAIVGAIRGHGADPPAGVLDQRFSHRRVSGVAAGKREGQDLTRPGVDGKVELAPRAALLAVLVPAPLTRAMEGQAGAVQHEIDRRLPPRRIHVDRHRPWPSRQGGVVGDRQYQAHQLEETAHEPLGLAQRQAEQARQHEHRLDRQVREPSLPTPGSPPRRGPGG
jgi:hypothetical protein